MPSPNPGRYSNSLTMASSQRARMEQGLEKKNVKKSVLLTVLRKSSWGVPCCHAAAAYVDSTTRTRGMPSSHPKAGHSEASRRRSEWRTTSSATLGQTRAAGAPFSSYAGSWPSRARARSVNGPTTSLQPLPRGRARPVHPVLGPRPQARTTRGCGERLRQCSAARYPLAPTRRRKVFRDLVL